MPQYEIEIPGRGTFQVSSPTPLTDAQAYAAALNQASSTPPEDKTGFSSALGAGFRGGVGETATGLGELTGIEALTQFGKRQQEAAAKGFTPTSEADIEAASKRGMLPEAGAYFSKYISEPLGGLVGGLAGRYGAPIAAGAVAPEGALGVAAFAAVNAPIHIGENLQRQKEQGQPRDMMSATAAGIGQAAIDSLGGEFLAGPMRGIVGKTAVEQAEPLAKRVLAGELSAADAATQLSGQLRSVAQATAQNAVAGTGLMVGDEALRRAAAGQGITDPEAVQAYIEQAKGAAEVAPFFGLAHGLGMPGKGRGVLESAETERMGIENAAAEKAAAEAKAAEEARRQTPEFAQEAADRWSGFQNQLNELNARAKAKVDKNDLMAVQDANDARQQAKDLKKSDEFQQAFKDFRETAATRATLKQQRDAIEAQRIEDDKQKDIQAQLQKMREQPGVQQTIPGLEPMETENVAPKPAEDLAAKRSEFMQKQQELAQLMEDHQRKESDAAAQGNIDLIKQLRPRREMLANEQDYINKQLETLGPEEKAELLDSINGKIQKKQAQLKSLGGEGYDPEKADKLISDIEA
jgi:hypothetical protein